MESYKICLIDLGRSNLTAGIALATLVGGLLLKKWLLKRITSSIISYIAHPVVE